MLSHNRRSFLTITALTAAALPLYNLLAAPARKKRLIHHVFFWLKNPSSPTDRAQLIAGLNTLRPIKPVRELRIGVPASTEKRGVVESSYHVSLLIFCNDAAAEQAYQVDPIHKKFVADCAHLWERVVVYDVQEI